MSTQAVQSPGRLAVTVALAVFVGVSSLFVAAVAIAIAPIQTHSVGMTGEPQDPNVTMRWSCYLLAAVALANGVYALGSGRKDLNTALISTALFVVTNIALGGLYLRTW